MKKLTVLLLLSITTHQLLAATSPDDIIGVWANSSNKAHIQIFKRDNLYYGKIIWLRTPKDNEGKPKVDVRNPNIKLRRKPIIGLEILHDFKYDDEEWKHGKIYNPNDGKEYKAYIKMNDLNNLAVRGYIGFSMFGKTETFTRIK